MRKINSVRVLLMCVWVMLFSMSAGAQLSHYVYLQTDNRQAFFIRYNGKIYSSTASGYLILSKLNEGNLQFSVGFPKSNEPEQKFELLIDKSDRGFLLKNFSDKGWGLFDLQTSAVLYAAMPQQPAGNIVTQPSAIQQPPANDPFANMLSQVTKDTTVKTVVVQKEEKKADTPKVVAPPVVKINNPVKDTVQTVVITVPESKPVIKQDTVVVSPTEPEWQMPKKSFVQTIRKFESKEGTDLVFEVTEDGLKDTIRVFIAADSVKMEAEVQPVQNTITTKDTITVVETKPEIKQEVVVQPEVKKEEIVPQKEPEKTQEKIQPQPQPTEIKQVPNSNCSAIAGEDDFVKLRRKMAMQSKEENMVSEARKAFKTKCFTVAQLKNLSVLFLTDEWRYRFYDAALPFVTDFPNFRSLEETIQDPYYKKRFQALLPAN